MVWHLLFETPFVSLIHDLPQRAKKGMRLLLAERHPRSYDGYGLTACSVPRTHGIDAALVSTVMKARPSRSYAAYVRALARCSMPCSTCVPRSCAANAERVPKSVAQVTLEVKSAASSHSGACPDPRELTTQINIVNCSCGQADFGSSVMPGIAIYAKAKTFDQKRIHILSCIGVALDHEKQVRLVSGQI